MSDEPAAASGPREEPTTLSDRELCDVIERVRVECSEHRDVSWRLGAIYALDILKPRLRAAMNARKA